METEENFTQSATSNKAGKKYFLPIVVVSVIFVFGGMMGWIYFTEETRSLDIPKDSEQINSPKSPEIFHPQTQSSGNTQVAPSQPEAITTEEYASPEDLVKEMVSVYPNKWVTYTGKGFSLRYPPTLVINPVDNGILASVPDEKMELEPGSPYPFHFSIKIFKPSVYHSAPVEDYIKSDGSYLAPKMSDFICGNIKIKQETYDTAGPEMSQGKIHRLTLLHNQQLYEFEYSYGWMGDALSSTDIAVRTEEETFVANNEKLGCDVLSTLQFLN